MRTLFLFLILTTAAVASDRRREPIAIISTPSGGNPVRHGDCPAVGQASRLP